jgi:hypothetical protein
MKSLLRRILESEDDFNSLYHKKNKWVDIQGLEKKILSKNLFDLVQHAYKDIGGHFEIKSPDDLLQYQFIKAEDVDDDPEADVMQVYKKTPAGIKSIVAGQDGSSEAKRELLSTQAKNLFKPGVYSEVSGKLAEIYLNKFKVPFVNSKEEVEEILRKPVKWIGDGWYERNVSGAGNHKKILVGRPKL